MNKQKILHWMEKRQSEFTDMAKWIWEHPQLAYEEDFAYNLQVSKLKDEGFTIHSPISGISTAFTAEYGSGKPIIGILGEYDALPGLSQKVSAVQEQVVSNGPGHGCGHNLLGTAGVEGVIALKKVMEEENLSGTIRYYGCPAEEVLSGKTFMARSGVFNDLDCALTWHPWTSNSATNMSMQSMVSIKFNFKGIPAHAAASPHAGRSALDAVELMNVGANYLREHVSEGSRIHYVITNGGLAPNIVPEYASVWYYLRAATKEQVEDMLRRVQKISQGAALMTETEVNSEMEAFAYNTLPNETINDLMYENMQESGSLQFTDEEQNFAQEIVKTIDPDILKMAQKTTGELLPITYQNDKQTLGKTMPGSTDVGDVSWITPVGSIMTTCAPVGVQLHSWQATASFGSPIGFKGMHFAAQTMALSAYDLLMNRDNILDRTKEEFQKSTDGKRYVAGISDEVKPPCIEKIDNTVGTNS
ncbi:amidohydrolase [Aquibacillus sp. 3ASR75-11]|uniref:Amidohydrolase n=1 Tax=Terrihalobacillus insolitus TaxID=2950438 RepID=A0A9X3WVB1_9BACI|nr:amidohydrolase [Terrihalobacillus insolitus]MDC3413990.1 amidohydrolase [Terrihalobacillus insolitus]MDC3424079.1 amidohydrolase [Terrihalobacillus insolitus]